MKDWDNSREIHQGDDDWGEMEIFQAKHGAGFGANGTDCSWIT